MNAYPGSLVAERVGGFVAPENPRLKMFSTLTILAGSVLTVVTMPGAVSDLEMYRHYAYAFGAVLACAIGIEAFGGARSMIRVDMVALTALYFLTFAEFLHPRVRILFDQQTGTSGFASELVLIGFCGIAVGRHLAIAGRRPGAPARPHQSLPELSPKAISTMFFGFAFLGYLYPLISTDFNPVTIVNALVQARFDRPWQRSSEGGWVSFLTELQLLNYLVAALGGYIFGNTRKFSLSKRIGAAAILLFMLFFDFNEGARNVVLIKTGLFLVAFFISNREAKSLRIIILSVLGAAALWTVSGYMLDIRNTGLAAYTSETARPDDDGAEGTFMIDNNMVSIARVLEVFPGTYPFPGTDIVIDIFTKWVPRAIWPGKPMKWTISIEDALNTGGGYTLAVTYVGEAYLIAGIPSLVIVSLLIGMASAAWTRVGVAARTNLDLIYYASGFFAASLCMRSVQWITIGMVPTVAFYIFGRFLARNTTKKRYAA